MKNSILAVLALLLLSCVTLSAQVNFGLRTGLNLSGFNTSSSQIFFGSKSDDGWKPALRMHTGFFLEIPLQDKLLFQPELVFNLKGAASKSSDQIDGWTGLGYISAPLLVSYEPNKSIRILAGPEFGYFFKSVGYGTTDFNKLDVGLTIGTAYHFEGEFFNGFSLGLRGTYGLKEATKFQFLIVEDSGLDTYNQSIRNYNLQLTMGMNLNKVIPTLKKRYSKNP